MSTRLARHCVRVTETRLGVNTTDGIAMSDTVKYLLEESRLPKEWYNINS